MEARDRRALIALLLLAVGVGVVGLMLRGGGSARATDAPLEITPEVRAAGLRFAPDVTERDRAWVLAAIASARPEARRLIDEVDGLVEVRVYANDPTALGKAHMDSHGLAISLDAHALNGDRAIERNAVVLHELGHIIDYVLVPDDLMQELDRSIPRGGACGPNGEPTGGCTAVEERFADTFMKWALRGEVSMAGGGYHIPAPASLEDWGAPLGLMAAKLTLGT